MFLAVTADFSGFLKLTAFAADECHMPPLDEKQMGRYSAFVGKRRTARQAKAATALRGAPARALGESRPYEGLRPAVGERKLLALLVDFDDRPYYGVKPQMRTAGYFENLLFNESRGSLNRYFIQASGGKLKFSGGVLKISPAAGVEAFWYRSVRPYRYWGKDEAAFESIDSNDISSLAAEVITNASRHMDFSVYDTDHDGVVSPYELHILILHSGSGQEFTAASDDIWSHRSTLETPVMAGGVMIENYILIAHDSPLGVLCHEVAHDLGLFDIYDTYSGASVLGAWSLMDRGAWNGVYPKSPGAAPALPSAYERMVLGWIKPVVVGQTREELYLKCPSSYRNIEKLNGLRVADAVKIEAPGSGGTEYLLFENRYKTRDTFDDDLPPAFKRENGILAYHIDEKMPDRTVYQYANDSRNSFYRVSLAGPPSCGADLAYYAKEFSRYSSRLQKFHTGAPNMVRMNCVGVNSEFTQVVFNNPYAHIASYEVAFADGAFDAAVRFSHFNKGFSYLSAHLSARGGGGGEGGAADYYPETALFENEPVESNYFHKKVPVGALRLLDSGNYFVRFRLMDGDYYEQKTFGPFTVANSVHRSLRILPAAINRGEVSVTVYLSPAAAASSGTEEVFYSYTDRAGYGVEKQAAFYGRSNAVWDCRTYRFFVDDQVASDVLVKVVSKEPFPANITGEVRVVRGAPKITHGVYTAPVLDGVITVMAESDRRLFQAQLLIAENGAGTVSVGMYSRYGDGPFVYYYNYAARSSGVVSYILECVDAAGNSARSEGATFVYRFPIARGTNYFAYEDGTIEMALTAAPPELAGRLGYLSVRRSDGAIEVKIMPEEFNAYGFTPASGFKILLKADAGGRRFDLISASGVRQRPVAGGYFELAGFGLYRAFEPGTAPVPAPLDASSTIAVPNPARYSFRVIPRSGGFNPASPPRLRIYDAAMTLVGSCDDYSGGPVDASGYAPGVYFYSLEGAGVKSAGRLTVVR